MTPPPAFGCAVTEALVPLVVPPDVVTPVLLLSADPPEALEFSPEFVPPALLLAPPTKVEAVVAAPAFAVFCVVATPPLSPPPRPLSVVPPPYNGVPLLPAVAAGPSTLNRSYSYVHPAPPNATAQDRTAIVRRAIVRLMARLVRTCRPIAAQSVLG